MKPLSSAIAVEHRPGCIVILTFDKPGSSANILDEPTLRELDGHLSDAADRAETKGLILGSAKPKIFIAGADIHAVQGLDEIGLRRYIELGQQVFGRLRRLPFPTVAAIHGACLGGGLELALACDWRVASSDKATKIGLPETQLGILPAWGGSTLLPRLIGLPKALDLILGGKQLASGHAAKLGVVDVTVYKEHLLGMAEKLLARGKRRPKSRWLLNNRAVAWLLRKQAGKSLAAKTRGHYPAVTAALEVVTKGVGVSLEDSLRNEREAIANLAHTQAARNLIGLFQLQEQAKKRELPGEGEPRAIRRVAVIGAGVMGAGIAQWLAARGVPVLLSDVNAEALGRGMGAVDKLFGEAVKRRVMTPLEAGRGRDLITPALGKVPLNRIDLVIEAAVEKLEIKKAIFRDLEERCEATTLLATNTSALPIGELADGLRHPERLLGLHFFNPVHRMQLIELVLAEKTSSEAARASLAFIKAIGKLPVVVKDSPGFLVNRVLLPYLVEAGRLFEEGVEAKVIDDAMLDFGMPMGPLRLIDEVGTDVSLHVANTLHAALGPRLEPPPILAKMIAAGLLGKKSGGGFYLHGKKETPNPAAVALRSGQGKREIDSLSVRERLVSLAVNEAARCLEEKVVESAEEVDLAMILGTGWTPFRGGVLRHADTEGTAKCLAVMERLAESEGERFQPCALITEIAKGGRVFHRTSGPPRTDVKLGGLLP